MTVKTQKSVATTQTQIAGRNVVLPIRTGPGISLAPVTAQNVNDRVGLVRVLTDWASKIVEAHALASNNPMASMTRLTNQSFAAGQAIMLSHNLQVPYASWACINAKLNPWLGIALPLDSGHPATQFIYLQSFNAGTYDFEVMG